MTRHPSPLRLPALCLFLAALPAHAGALSPGDIVMLGSSIYRVDPVTLSRTPLSSGGLLLQPVQIAVGAGPTIYFTDILSGVVAVDPETGAQSVLTTVAGLDNRHPRGICRAGPGALYVTAMDDTYSGGNAAIFRVDTSDGSVQQLAANGLMSRPDALALGPDGLVYIAEGSQPPGNGVYPNYRGTVLRFDPATSSLDVLPTDTTLYIAPFDIAVAPNGDVWTAQIGNVARRLGYFVRTRAADAHSEVLGSVYQRSLSVAIGSDGTIYMGDCQTIGPDCYYPFLFVYPNGVSQMGPTGDMDIVPGDVTPVRSTRWGALKAMYR